MGSDQQLRHASAIAGLPLGAPLSVRAHELGDLRPDLVVGLESSPCRCDARSVECVVCRDDDVAVPLFGRPLAPVSQPGPPSVYPPTSRSVSDPLPAQPRLRRPPPPAT